MPSRPNKPDYVFLGLLAAVLAVGFVVLTSASAPLGAQKFQDGFYYLKHQALAGLLPGAVLFLVLSAVDYRFWRRLWPHLYVAAVVLLVLVFIPGLAADWGTSRSWLNVYGFSFQPVEAVKLLFVLAMAGWLTATGERGVADWRSGFLPFVTGVGLVAGLLVLQPDTGGMFALAFIAAAQYFAAGAPFTHLVALVAMGAAGLWAVVRAAPYRLARFMTFLNPELDPSGRGYHINQAFLAVGSGGIFGLGLGHSRQKYLYLPEVAGDSIMAVMAEEFGFVLMVAFIALFAAFVWRGLTVARRAPDDYGRYVAVGIVAWVGGQALLNIGSIVGLMPMTGLPFPFVSYGGTAMMSLLAAMGVMVSVSRFSGTRASRR